MEFISTLLGGLSSGGTYAMIALGYTMVYGIAKMLNFAHGDIIMVGGYILYIMMLKLSQNIFVGVLVAVLFCVLLGITVERLAYRPLRGASPLAVLITAIGVSYLLQSVAQLIFGSKSQAVTITTAKMVKIASAEFNLNTILTLVVGAIIMIVLTLFIKFTRTGRAMQAVSEDRGAAQLMGVNVNKIIMITFAIGSALAACAGVFYLMQIPSVSPTLGSMPGIKAFAAAVIGGIGSIPGAMLGGVLLGVVEKLALSVPVLAPYANAIVFALLIIILLVRPIGLLGKKRREKV